MSTVLTQNPRTHINRFRLLRRLGQGAEGIVYLAADPQLGRQVAIKTLNLGGNPDLALADRLLDAAKTVSTLSHPNIVPVFEVGMHENQPFVVFEYVQGRTLADLIETEGALPMAGAVVMMSQILAGVAHVHASGVLHGDLKPANILIGANGIPRVTDFGISRRVHTAANVTVNSGTLRYMAPESFVGGRTDYRYDVFALGLIFHEMLTGEPVFTGRNHYTQIHRIVHEAALAPSHKNARIAPELDALTLRALNKNPDHRYADAAEMKRELDRFRVPAAPADCVELHERCLHSTAEFLLRRMAIKSDFPALSATFTRINQLLSSADHASLNTLADVIMRDFALTQKLLRVVNTAAFGTAKVTKVSQAITLLGVSQLRAIAAGMILSSGGKTGPDSPEVGAALTDAFVTAVIARNIGRLIGLKEVEESFICGMFGQLGQLLTLFYLSEENAAITRRMLEQGEDAAAASRAVLGLSFDQLGIAVARKWNFPDTIVNSMLPLPRSELPPPACDAHRMWYCVGYAREFCNVFRIRAPTRREQAFSAHILRFQQAVDISTPQVFTLIAHSIEVALQYVAASGLMQPKTALLDGLRSMRTGFELRHVAKAD